MASVREVDGRRQFWTGLLTAIVALTSPALIVGAVASVWLAWPYAMTVGAVTFALWFATGAFLEWVDGRH